MPEKEGSLGRFVPGSSERALQLAMRGQKLPKAGIAQRLRGFVTGSGRDAGREAAEQFGTEASRLGGQLKEELPELAEQLGARFVRGGLRSAAVPAGVGAGVGLLAGVPAGYTISQLQERSKKETPMVEGHKYAGVTLDYYDDHGETLKARFPTADELPDMIKSANVQSKEKLPNEAFALIMVDQGHVFRKFACADPGTTAMSVIYFMEHGDKLPKEAQKTAASNLVEACLAHDIMPPATLTKVASYPGIDDDMEELQRLEEEDRKHPERKKKRDEDELATRTMLSKSLQKKASVVDVTGQRPAPKIVSARPVDEDDYAVKLADGSLHYPIDTWDRVKQAEAYFLEERIRMEPELRRQYAVKLARKSFIMGYPLDQDVTELGALSYNDDSVLQGAVEMRKSACAPQGIEHGFLDDLFEKRATLHPEVYAECLRRFDVMNDLHQGWDHVILDPWASTFGVKTASIVWEQGADRVTSEELINLARNSPKSLETQFSTDFVDQFQKDPEAIFNSMPDPQKKLIARLANDSASMGGSEFMPTAAPTQEAGGHGKSLS